MSRAAVAAAGAWRAALGKPKLPRGGATTALDDGGAGAQLALTMMSPNCSGVLSRPRVLIGSSKAWPRGDGRLADPARRRIQVLVADRVGDVTAVMLQAAIFCGSSQQRML